MLELEERKVLFTYPSVRLNKGLHSVDKGRFSNSPASKYYKLHSLQLLSSLFHFFQQWLDISLRNSFWNAATVLSCMKNNVNQTITEIVKTEENGNQPLSSNLQCLFNSTNQAICELPPCCSVKIVLL